MSTRQEGAPSRLVRSRDDLVAWIAAGEKPQADWRIGTEHEKFVFHTDTLTPVAYEGERSIRALMKSLDRPLRLGADPRGRQDHRLEASRGRAGRQHQPGARRTVRAFRAPRRRRCTRRRRRRTEHLHEVLNVGEPLGIGFLGLGFSPKWTLAETPHMPKERYAIMTRYMPKVGTRGLDMMYRTATIQVNLDFADEADMVKKLRVSLALQPIATALFCLLAVHRRPPQRLQVDAQRGVARHRSPPHRHAAVRLRDRHGL